MNRAGCAVKRIYWAVLLGLPCCFAGFVARAETALMPQLNFNVKSVRVDPSNRLRLDLSIYYGNYTTRDSDRSMDVDAIQVRCVTVKADHSVGTVVYSEVVTLERGRLLLWDASLDEHICVKIPAESGSYRLELDPIPNNPTVYRTRNTVRFDVTCDRYSLFYLLPGVLGVLLLLWLLSLLSSRKIRLHLLTLIALVLTAGLLLALNARLTFQSWYIFFSSYRIYKLTGSPGWPWPFISAPFRAEPLWEAVLSDSIVFVAILIAVAIVMELLFRARKPRP